MARGNLVAESLDRGRAGADPGHPGVDDGSREFGVFCQESVTGVHRVRLRSASDRDDLRNVQVRVGGAFALERKRFVGEVDVERIAVRIRVDGDRTDAAVAAGADDPHRNLAAVGYKDLRDRSLGRRGRGLQ